MEELAKAVDLAQLESEIKDSETRRDKWVVQFFKHLLYIIYISCYISFIYCPHLDISVKNKILNY